MRSAKWIDVFTIMKASLFKQLLTTHVHTAEWIITTFKDNSYRRLDSLNQDEIKWIKHIDNITKTYNSTEHTITQIKPNEAGQESSLGAMAFAK